MDMETYRNIGEAYQYVQKIEEYGPGGIPASKLGMWLTLNNDADHGVVNMLLEIHQDFVIANEDNLNQLTLLIIPGHPVLTKKQAERINNWVDGGGKLIVFGEGALDLSKSEFVIDVGAAYKGSSDFNFDYTVVHNEIGHEVVTTPFLNYESGILMEPIEGKVLASIREPYFNRTYKKYSSHRETPYKLEDSPYPAVIRNGNIIFFAHHLDQLYYQHGVRLHRQLFENAIQLLYEKPYLEVENLPSAGRVSLLKQENRKRFVAHLLYSPPLQRGEVMVIEDFLPVPGVELDLNLPEKINKVYQIPGESELDYNQTKHGLSVKVPPFTMHTAIVLEY
jgi:hypothetical protein